LTPPAQFKYFPAGLFDQVEGRRDDRGDGLSRRRQSMVSSKVLRRGS
jgi:hypothetical protein